MSSLDLEIKPKLDSESEEDAATGVKVIDETKSTTSKSSTKSPKDQVDSEAVPETVTEEATVSKKSKKKSKTNFGIFWCRNFCGKKFDIRFFETKNMLIYDLGHKSILSIL